MENIMSSCVERNFRFSNEHRHQRTRRREGPFFKLLQRKLSERRELNYWKTGQA